MSRCPARGADVKAAMLARGVPYVVHDRWEKN